MPKQAPFGSWTSPVSAAHAASAAGRLVEPSRVDGALYWLEGRPAEGGRSAIVEWRDGQTRDLLPAPWNARSRVHEYGGGSYLVAGGTVYFCNFADQRIYRQSLTEGDPTPLTPEDSGSFADLILDRRRQRLIAVREAPSAAAHEPEATLAAIPVDGRAADDENAIQRLASGHDFYSTPRLSPDEGTLLFLSWDHPDMPWDGTELWEGALNESGQLEEPRCIAGSRHEAIFAPGYLPDGRSVYVSDRSGFWNLYLRETNGDTIALAPGERSFGLPHWVFRMSTWAATTENRLLTIWCQGGEWSAGILDLGDRTMRELELPFTVLDGVEADLSGHAVLIAAGPEQPPAVVTIDVDRRTHEKVHALSAAPDPRYVSAGQPVSFPTTDGDTAHAFFYPPRNEDFEGRAGEKPLLIVKSHGGPTAMTTNDYSAGIQFWTSRGFAVVDVNYRGSTGFGRDYRHSLRGNWGIKDVDDCVAAATWLAERGEVDGRRLAIRGGSAGGYTTLAALAFRDVFSAGASHYGVADLEALARDTHKFEARYLDGLIGPYPERSDLYRERSPIHAAQGLDCPVIFFQGTEDKIVPPNQAEAMVAALAEKGVPVAYVSFEGEQHGFRKAENIVRALEAELWFYARIFGFEAADEIEPVEMRGGPPSEGPP